MFFCPFLLPGRLLVSSKQSFFLFTNPVGIVAGQPLTAIVFLQEREDTFFSKKVSS